VETKKATNGKTTRESENDWIFDRNGRTILFRLETFRTLVNNLVGEAGAEAARRIFYNVGMEVGKNSFKYSTKKAETDEDIRSLFDKLLTFRGWGKCLDVGSETSDRGKVYTVTVSECPLCREQNAPPAVACGLLRGTVAGWFEAKMGEKAIGELGTDCAIQIGRSCIVQTRFDGNKPKQGQPQ
jgi:predicted hydrocarbon binding protein